MVKSKRNVNEFQKAMLTNTKVIGNAENADTGIKPTNNNDSISPKLMEAYEKLADKVDMDKNDLIEIALRHFLNLEDVWFKSK